MNSFLSSLLVTVLVVYLGVCLFLYVTQRSFIYFPTPESLGEGAVDLRIFTGEETLQVWQLNPGRPDALLYFGGNAEDVAANIPMFYGIFPDFTVYLVNNRGYGASTGSPTEAGLINDARALYDHLASDHEHISAIGRSLGSGLAVQLAASRPLDRLVLVTPFDSIARVAAGAMPWLPVQWLLKDRFESWRFAPDIDAPALALIAERDSVIPRARSDQLVAAFQPESVAAIVIPGTDHNDISSEISYWDLLRQFLAPAG